MRVDTRRMKSASRAIEAAGGKGWLADRLVQIVGQGKKAFDTVRMELGRLLAEAIMLMDREEVSGPDYQPVILRFRSGRVSRGRSTSATGRFA